MFLRNIFIKVKYLTRYRLLRLSGKQYVNFLTGLSVVALVVISLLGESYIDSLKQDSSQSTSIQSVPVVAVSGSDGGLLAHVRTTPPGKKLDVQWLMVSDTASIFSFLSLQTARGVLTELETFDNFASEDQVILGNIFGLSSAFYFSAGGSIFDIPNGTVVVMPEDAQSQNDALTLLSDSGLVTLGDGEGLSSVISNPKNLVLQSRAQTDFSHAIEEGALVFVPGLQATQFDFRNPVLVSKISESHVLIVDRTWAESEDAKKLLQILTNKNSQKYLQDNWGEILTFPKSQG